METKKLYHFHVKNSPPIDPQGYALAENERQAIALFLARAAASGWGFFRLCRVNPQIEHLRHVDNKWILSRTRYRVIATHPQTFHDLIVSEMDYAQ